MFPVFHVVRSDSSSAVGFATTVSYGKECWIAEDEIGCLMNATKLIFGHWQSRGNDWAFAPDDLGELYLLAPDTDWIVLDGYWGERAELVLDTNRKWRESPFSSSPSEMYDSQGHPQGKGEWNHEHCAVCSETIGCGGESTAYVNDDDKWVCVNCYQSFVSQRSLAFIPTRKN